MNTVFIKFALKAVHTLFANTILKKSLHKDHIHLFNRSFVIQNFSVYLSFMFLILSPQRCCLVFNLMSIIIVTLHDKNAH